MNLKDTIHNLARQNKELNAFIDTAFNQNADDSIVDFVNFLNLSGYNSIISLYFAHVLQSASDPKLSEQFDLEDIELLYESFLVLNDKCSDIYIDAANFAESVLNNKTKAKQIAEYGIERLQIQINELKELLNDIAV